MIYCEKCGAWGAHTTENHVDFFVVTPDDKDKESNDST